jgi:glycosyltransferase involved in cell wall biosynthesis
MVIVSCIKKFHAFSLSEQLERKEILTNFFTSYAYQKNTILKKIVNRIDKENIEPNKISTNILSAFRVKFFKDDFQNLEYFDRWVSSKIQNYSDAKFFIGWSAMSLNSLLTAKKNGLITILERGSSHIKFQNQILKKEYNKFGHDFKIDQRVINKELNEYAIADYISIPSNFVKNSFLQMGISEKKLIVNNYGVSSYFSSNVPNTKSDKFIILYLGTISIRKGLIYLFDAISDLGIPENKFEIRFIGQVDSEMELLKKKYTKSNWRWYGKVNHYELSKLIVECDVAVQPSLEEGLSMVIPQILACGVPVISTTNTGGEDLIMNEKNGFIIPICSSEKIKEKILLLYNDSNLLEKMKNQTKISNKKILNWDLYGDRYYNNLLNIINKH